MMPHKAAENESFSSNEKPTLREGPPTTLGELWSLIDRRLEESDDDSSKRITALATQIEEVDKRSAVRSGDIMTELSGLKKRVNALEAEPSRPPTPKAPLWVGAIAAAVIAAVLAINSAVSNGFHLFVGK